MTKPTEEETKEILAYLDGAKVYSCGHSKEYGAFVTIEINGVAAQIHLKRTAEIIKDLWEALEKCRDVSVYTRGDLKVEHPAYKIASKIVGAKQ